MPDCQIVRLQDCQIGRLPDCRIGKLEDWDIRKFDPGERGTGRGWGRVTGGGAWGGGIGENGI